MKPPTTTAHLFRFLPPRPARWVMLKGDFIDWFKRHGMDPCGDGAFAIELDLPPGVYSYKFHVDETDYFLDPANPRTEAADAAHRNSLLVVGGTQEPVVHAPARPHLFVDDAGALIVRARLRRGSGAGLDLLTYGVDGEVRVPMAACGEDAEHLSFEACFPEGAPHGLRYLFEVSGPGALAGTRCGRGSPLAPFEIAAPALPRLAPEPSAGLSIYRIVLDRFRSSAGPLPWPIGPGVEEIAGGDLRGAALALPHLADLGVDALLLTPVGRSPTYHRYDLLEPLHLDPNLGTEEDLRALVDGAHARGLKVLFDCAVSHVNPGFFAFRDLVAKGPESRYVDWFHVFRFPIEVNRQNPAFLHYPDGPHLPMLNTRNPEVVAYLEEYVERWTRTGIDGWRLDAVADVPRETYERLARAITKVNPDAWILGELVPDGAARYLGRPAGVVSDFPTSNALLRFFLRRDGDAEDLSRAIGERCYRFGADFERMLLFLADLDQARPLTVAGDPALVRLAAMFLFTAPCTPLVLYGDEVGLSSRHGAQNFEQGLDRVPMPWTDVAGKWDFETLRCLRRLFWLRGEAPVAHGAFQVLHASGPVFAWSRGDDQDEVVGLASISDSPVRVPFTALGGPLPRRAPVVAQGHVEVGEADVLLGPRSGALFRRAAALETGAEVDPQREDPGLRNLARVDRAFRRGSTGGAVPTRWYLNLTERCNLRCAHCITHAPDRTASRTARDMAPEVLERLAPHLESALYVGFVHAGEPTVSPLLVPTLLTLKEARGGRPTVVHLLTNGMTLSEERFLELAGLGVNSLSFSIDGASAATNDVLRQGSRFEHLAELLPRLAALRRERGLDVRMGVACTVTRSNVSELAAVVRFVAGAGLDWVKFEEVFPVNPFSEREADIAKPLLAKSLKAAKEAARRAKIVLLDHLESPTVRRCLLTQDDKMRAFSQGDDFVNRMRIDGCRLPFELACVEPDGDVKPLTFHHPPAGNLLRQGLEEIWEGELFRLVREQSVRERQCPSGCADCEPDPGPTGW